MTASPTPPSPAPAAAESPESTELAKSFDPEPPAAAPVVTATPPPPLPDLRQPFREATEAAQRALSSKDVDAAKAHAKTATSEAANLGIAERVQAAQLTFKVAVASESTEWAKGAAHEWLRTCGGDGVDACRAQALNAILTVAKLDGSLAKELREEVADLQKADACFKASERAKKLDRCFHEAEQTAKSADDQLLLSRAALAKAAAAPEPKQLALWAAVDERCEVAACVAPRRKALARLIAKAKAEKRFEDAARFAIRDLQALTLASGRAEKTYVRSAETDAVCAAFDGQSGPGACRKLEKQLTGGWTFRDFSKDKPREGLSGDQVRTVNEHYLPLLQECLAAQAKRLRPPESARYDVRWMVFNDGRVGEVHFKDGSLEKSELASCLRSQFETWRYPRYDGEWQHVEQSFTVTAVERRSER